MAFQQQELPWNEKNDGLSGRQCEGMLGEERSCFDWFGSFVLEFRSMSFVSRRWWLWNCEHMNIKKLLLCFGQNFSCSGFALIASGFFRRKSSYSFRSGYARRGKSSHCCLREFSLALPAACTPPRHATPLTLFGFSNHVWVTRIFLHNRQKSNLPDNSRSSFDSMSRVTMSCHPLKHTLHDNG